MQTNNNKENVNVNCNVGFYSKVAVPAIQQLAAKQVVVCQGITVTCQDIVGNFDVTYAQQNTVIHFRLSKDKNSLGGGSVRIHLHHTTRKVQIQGGALLPGNKKAPVWFLEHILEDKFTKLSQERSLEIQYVNQAVNDMVSNPRTNKNVPSVCAGCHEQFNGRSSPAYCSECETFFHKFKCFSTSKHPCHVKKRSQGCSTLPVQPMGHTSSIADNTTDTMMQYQQVLSLETEPQTESVTQVPGQNTHHTSSAPIQTSQDVQQTQLVSDQVLTQENPPQTSLDTTQPAPILPALQLRDRPATEVDPVAAPSNISNIPDSRVSATPLNPNAVPFNNEILSQPTRDNRKKTRTQKKNTIPTDATSIDLEFKEVQINTLQCKLQMFETENKDLKFRNSILMERNKILEEDKKKSIHDQHFPSDSSKTAPQVPPTQYPKCNHCNWHPEQQPHCYPHHPYSHCHLHSCVGQYPVNGPRSTGSDNISMSNISNRLEELRTVVTNLSNKVDDLTSFPTNTSSPSNPDTHSMAHTVPPDTPSDAKDSPSNPDTPITASTTPSDTPSDVIGPPMDTSTVSLDEFMFNEDGSDIHLN